MVSRLENNCRNTKGPLEPKERLSTEYEENFMPIVREVGPAAMNVDFYREGLLWVKSG